MHLVEVRDLKKVYDVRYGVSKTDSITAVSGLSFEIDSGEVFGLLGPNGAGKSSTIKMISTLITPTSGDAIVDGSSVTQAPEKVRAKIGVMLAGERNMYWKLTARENLQYFSTLYHLDPRKSKERIESLLNLVGLADHPDARVESYSTGMRIRLSFAKALLNDASVLLLDEPTMSLDPQAALIVREAIAEQKDQGKAVLLTTHNMEEADRLSDRVGIIDHGKLISTGPPSQIRRSYRDKSTLRIKVRNLDDAVRILNGVTGVEGVSTTSNETTEPVVEVTTNGDDVLVNLILRSLADSDVRVVSFNVVEPTLEDVFIRLTGRSLRD